MSWNDHDHCGEYAEPGHTHYDYADEHHRHYDLERGGESARHGIDELHGLVSELRGQLHGALGRIAALEKQTPQARQLQLEADLAAADLAESGYDRHGRDCRCSYCATDDELEEDDPGRTRILGDARSGARDLFGGRQ